MSLVNVISAIGNNRSVYPLLVRDCGIEIPSKVVLTYNQNLKDSKQMAYSATRERLIDEYGTSAIWLGGIPVMNKLCDWIIKKCGYNPNVNMSLFNEESSQGIRYNIEKFKDKAPDAVRDLEKALKNKSKYQKLQAGKFILSTAVPVALMGFVLPKLNFKLTEILSEKQAKTPVTRKSADNAFIRQEEEFLTNLTAFEGKNDVSFRGVASSLANMSNVNKMAVTDGGLTAGRVYTARNKYEKMEMAFKMSMMMFLNFVFPVYLAKGLDYLSGKLFKTNVNFDPKLMINKEFLEEINNGTIKLPKDKESIIEFLDKNPDSRFSKLCEEYCNVKYLKGRIRDPRAYVETNKIDIFRKEIEKFSKEAKQNGNISKYAKKALKVKSANILANVGISSFLLAVTLPKVTFMLRKLVTGSDSEPGLVVINSKSGTSSVNSSNL